MGITLEFYSAEPERFVSLQEVLASIQTDEYDERQANEQLASYPRADFSLHLRWPEDIEAVCQAMIVEGLDVPGSCAELLVEELWFDGYSAWVDRVSQALPQAIAGVDNATLKHIAERWVGSSIPDPQADPAYSERAYEAAVKALTELRMVSRDALERGRALLLFRLW
jgi:hypothetical protein